MQALAAAQAQAQLQRQMLAQQQALLAAVPTVTPPAAALVAAAAAGGATVATGLAVDSTTARKSREVYIGNLSIGSVTPDMLTELFNAALAGMVPDPVNEPPVINVKMDNTGVNPYLRTAAQQQPLTPAPQSHVVLSCYYPASSTGQITPHMNADTALEWKVCKRRPLALHAALCPFVSCSGRG